MDWACWRSRFVVNCARMLNRSWREEISQLNEEHTYLQKTKLNMKMNKYILAAALGLGTASVINAATVYITGSTAFRGNTETALNTAGVVFSPAPTETKWAADGSTYMAFQGTGTAAVNGGAALTVLCAWSGSEAGVQDISQIGGNENFPDASVYGGTFPGGSVAGHAPLVAHAVDIAMADNDAPFSRVYAITLPAGTALPTRAEVGVVTFKWVRNPGLWTGTSVSSLQIRQALNSGTFRSVFSGNAADVNNFVYVSGRDNGSGTRVNAFGESGFGIFNTPGQIEIDTTGNMVSVGGQFVGDFGYSSGGTLAGTMGASTVGKTDQVNGGVGGFSVIAYLGFNDANTAKTAGATELAFDGVPFSLGAITEGAYGFWGNEYIMIKTGAVAPAPGVYTALSASTGINATIPLGAANTSPNGIRLSDMDTTRSGPLGDPTHK